MPEDSVKPAPARDELIGKRLAHYDVTARLGHGGMGVVYLAHDERLQRDVALKVLPPETVADTTARARLLREARTASGLNHPHICTIHEVGEVSGFTFIAMEHLAGRPLSEVIPPGGLPVETLLRYGVQIADALAHAHEHGIVHRDLKCSNVIITPEGRAKVLDFGLAKQLGGMELSASGPRQSLTEAGAVVGTLDYMAPEVLLGEAADVRSDLWALGVMLYEMAAGERPFRGQTGFELSAAILHESPTSLPARVPASLRAVVQRCLAKDPSQRYQRAGEARAALELTISFPDSAPVPVVPPIPRARRLPVPVIAAAALIAAVGLGALLAVRWWPKPPLEYKQITFRHGLVGFARFSPDGQAIIYSAAWGEEPPDAFSASPGAPESRSLGFSDTWPLSLSPTGEMAMLLDHHLCPGPYAVGTLARAPLGGTPREIVDNVEFAEWSPDGKELAIVRDVGGIFRLEYPIGRLLYETPGWITHPRLSPGGDRIAFIEHPVENDLSGAIVAVDLKGTKRMLSQGWNNAFGLAWSPNGREVWFTAKKKGANRALYAVSLAGNERLVRSESSSLHLMDVARDGRVLLVRQTDRQAIVGQVAGQVAGQVEERDLSVQDWDLGVDLSDDGRTLLFQVGGGGGGGGMGSAYLRETDGSPAKRLGEGEPLALSPDGKWALVKVVGSEPAQLVLMPTGVGQPQLLPRDSITRKAAIWMPDGRHILSAGSEPGRPPRNYIQDIQGSRPRPVTPEGIVGSVTSPDGKWIAVPGDSLLYPIEGGTPRSIAGLQSGDVPLLWGDAGRSIYVQNGVLPASIYRIDLATGDREFLKDLAPTDPAGLTGVYNIQLSADGKSTVISYTRSLAELYLVTGLR